MIIIIPKHLRGDSASPTTTPNKDDCESRVMCNKPVNSDSFECVWCERWQHNSCIKISTEQVPSLQDLPTNIVFFAVSASRNKLPSALIAFDRTQEACSVFDKKLNSVQEEMCNRFESLAEKVNEFIYFIYLKASQHTS